MKHLQFFIFFIVLFFLLFYVHSSAVAISPPRPTPDVLALAIPTWVLPTPPCGAWDGTKCTSIDTALGEIGTQPETIITRIFSIILGLSGGIAFLTIISGSYAIMTSQGNPEKVQAAKEIITSTIVGLVFVILSIVILEIIGVDILVIPGFSK